MSGKISNHILFWVCYGVFYTTLDFFSAGDFNLLDELIVLIRIAATVYIGYFFLCKMRFKSFLQTLMSLVYFITNLIVFGVIIYFYRYIISDIFDLPQAVDRSNIKSVFINGLYLFSGSYFYALGYFFLTKSSQKEKQLRIAAEEKAELVEEKLVIEETNNQLLLTNQALEKKQLLTQSAFLRSQINPHFLQNTLNFLYGKTRKHAAELAEGVLLLSDIMRYSLEATKSDDDLTPLKEEMEHLKNLMKLQQLRFSNRLHVELSTTGNWQQVKIPPLTLITLAENAFKYGEMEEEQHPVTIHLHVTEDGKQLQFTVANKKKQGPVEVSYGIGHENIRNRLSMQYGNNFELHVTDEAAYYTVYLTVNLPQ